MQESVTDFIDEGEHAMLYFDAHLILVPDNLKSEVFEVKLIRTSG